ncbi:hypothetical protein [Mesorhizobium sp. L2C084A000]|uniref:hypothetical protein n=1 Tax=Mesorhizobium sp. L2C084A000 TaxID=1287116 RepID=UPI0003D058EB|nr:hypothetical protein [Mesorhizobium sp. L2C084A000]ESZ30601.1 hypothetical protein X734_04010 [Mesorhizobium sp. L2C084A000]
MNSFDIRNFPSLERRVQAHWAPILLEPISGSFERLVVGVAAANADGFHLEIANALYRLNCLYGDEAGAAVKAIALAADYLRRDLSQRSVNALLTPDPPLSGILFGPCQEGEGVSLEALAQSWMLALSSLYVPPGTGLVKIPEETVDLVAASENGGSGDRLPFLVCDYVKGHREGYGGYFSADLRQGRARRTKGGSHRIVIDFAGPKLVANFGTLRAHAITQSVYLIKRRLWDLKVDRDREPAVAFARAHEMILHRPPQNDPQVTQQQQDTIAEALHALEAQADQEELRLLAMDSVPAIGERIISYDAAA